MLSIRNINPMVRAIGTMGAVAALVGGVTYAFTSTPVVLADDSMNASASLLISTDGSTFTGSEPGFDFTGMVPGGAASADHTFYLENNGTNPVDLSVNVPVVPTFTVTPTASVDNTQVFVNMSCTSGSSGNFSLTSGNNLNQLNGSGGVTLTGGPLQPGDYATCSVNVSLGSSVVPTLSSSLSSTTFDLSFVGTD